MCVFYQDLFESKWSFSCASTAWNWRANKHKLWKGNFLTFSNQCNCSQCNRRTFIFFDIEFFVYFVEVIFLIVDLDHAGRLCLHIAFAWWPLICFYAQQFILVEFFLNTAESSKRINLFGCTEHVMTCMLITHLSFSESAPKSRNKVLNKNNRRCETTQKQQLWFQPRRLIHCKEASRFFSPKRRVKTHDNRKFKCFLSSHIFVQVCWAFFKYWISTLHAWCEDAHVIPEQCSCNHFPYW